MSSLEPSISYSVGSKNSLMISWSVENDGPVESTIVSLIPRPKSNGKLEVADLAREINKTKGEDNEHIEIALVRFVLSSIANSNEEKMAKAVYARAITLCRLRLSDLVLALVFRPLSSLVEDINWKYYKKKHEHLVATTGETESWEEYQSRLFSEKEIEKGRFFPETSLNEEQLYLWEIICFYTKLDSKLRSFSQYRSNNHHLPIIRDPFKLAVLVERMFSGVDTSGSAIGDFLNDFERLKTLYWQLLDFESRFECRLDCCFYAVLYKPETTKLFHEFLKDEIDANNKLFLLEAISSHPLKDLVVPYSKELRDSISELISSIQQVNHER